MEISKSLPDSISNEIKLCFTKMNDLRDLFNKFGDYRFIHLNSLRSFDLPTSFPTVIYLKIKRPISATDITTDGKIYDFGNGKVYTLFSSGIVFGYLFEFPKLKISIRENSLIVTNIQYDPINIDKVELILKNSTFSIYKSNSIILIILNRYEYISFKRSRIKKEESI